MNFYIADMCRSCFRTGCALSDKTKNHKRREHIEYKVQLKYCFPDMVFPEYSGYKLCNVCADILDEVYYFKLKLINAQKQYGYYLTKLMSNNTNIQNGLKFHKISIPLNKNYSNLKKKFKEDTSFNIQKKSEVGEKKNDILKDVNGTPVAEIPSIFIGTIKSEENESTNHFVNNKSNMLPQNKCAVNIYNNNLETEVKEESFKEEVDFVSIDEITEVKDDNYFLIDEEVNIDGIPIELAEEIVNGCSSSISSPEIILENSKLHHSSEDCILIEDEEEDCIEVTAEHQPLLQSLTAAKDVTERIHNHPKLQPITIPPSQRMPVIHEITDESTVQGSPEELVANAENVAILNNCMHSTSKMSTINKSEIDPPSMVGRIRCKPVEQILDISAKLNNEITARQGLKRKIGSCEALQTINNCQSKVQAITKMSTINKSEIDPPSMVGRIRCKPVEQILDISAKPNAKVVASVENTKLSPDTLSMAEVIEEGLNRKIGSCEVETINQEHQYSCGPRGLVCRKKQDLEITATSNSSNSSLINNETVPKHSNTKHANTTVTSKDNYPALKTSLVVDATHKHNNTKDSNTTVTSKDNHAVLKSSSGVDSTSKYNTINLSKSTATNKKYYATFKTAFAPRKDNHSMPGSSLLDLQATPKHNVASIRGGQVPWTKQCEKTNNPGRGCNLCNNGKLRGVSQTPTLYPCEVTKNAFHLYPRVNRNRHTCLWLDSMQKNVPAKICGKVFDGRAGLHFHLCEDHCRQDSYSHDTPRLCQWLGCVTRSTFPNESEFVRHVIGHPKVQNNDGSDVESLIKYYLITPKSMPSEERARSKPILTKGCGPVNTLGSTSATSTPPRSTQTVTSPTRASQFTTASSLRSPKTIVTSPLRTLQTKQTHLARISPMGRSPVSTLDSTSATSTPPRSTQTVTSSMRASQFTTTSSLRSPKTTITSPLPTLQTKQTHLERILPMGRGPVNTLRSTSATSTAPGSTQTVTSQPNTTSPLRASKTTVTSPVNNAQSPSTNYLCHFLGCDKQFTEKASLYEHMKAHEGSETFKNVNAQSYEELKAKTSMQSQPNTVRTPGNNQCFPAYFPQQFVQTLNSGTSPISFMPLSSGAAQIHVNGGFVNPVPQFGINNGSGLQSQGTICRPSIVSPQAVAQNSVNAVPQGVFFFQPNCFFVNDNTGSS